MTTDLALMILGPFIPVLTYVFLDQFVKWRADVAADIESDAADAATNWHLDWAFWTQVQRSSNPNLRRLANDMQAYLQASRPVDA